MKRYAGLGMLLFAFVLQSCIGTDVLDDLGDREPRLVLETGSMNAVDTLQVGDQLTLSAQFFDNTGQEANSDVKWSSSDAQVAQVSQAGVVTGIGRGSATITAEAEGLIAEHLVLVQTDERVEVSPSRLSLLVGTTGMLTGSYYNAMNVFTPSTMTWTSDNEAVATVDNAGAVTALANGQAKITASTNGFSAESLVTVVESADQVAEVVLSASGNSISVGQELAFTAEALNVNGDPVSGANFTWSSSEPALLSVDANGVATGQSVGTATVSAEADGVSSLPYTVLVSPMVTTSRTGNFVSSGGYTVNGSVTMSVEPNGDLKLDFDNTFTTSNGPGLYIYLSNSTAGGLSVASLPSTSGPFSVIVPGTIGINDYDFVLIWCEPFGVTFGYAELN